MLTESKIGDLILMENKILSLDPHDIQGDDHSSVGHDSTDFQTDEDDEIQRLSLLESLKFLLAMSMSRVTHMLMMMTDQHTHHWCRSQPLTQTPPPARLPDNRDIHENNSDIDILVDNHDIIISGVTGQPR